MRRPDRATQAGKADLGDANSRRASIGALVTRAGEADDRHLVALFGQGRTKQEHLPLRPAAVQGADHEGHPERATSPASCLACRRARTTYESASAA